MASRLPDETFVAIFGCGTLTRGDLETVMLVSKRFYRIAWDEIYPDLYRKISIESPQMLHLLLRSVIRNALLGPLIKHVALDWSSEEDSEDDHGSHTEIMEQVEAAKSHLPLVVADHLTCPSAPAAQALLLLSLLPALRILYVYDVREIDIFERYFPLILKNGHISTSLVEYRREHDKAHTSVRFVWGACVHDTGTLASSETAKYYGVSPIEVLSIGDSHLNSAQLEELLRLPKALQKFVLIATYAIPPRLDDALRWVAGSLEHLNIQLIGPSNRLATLRTLAGMKRLRFLYVHPGDMILDPEVKNPNLIDVLPASLEQMAFEKAWDDHLLGMAIVRLCAAVSTDRSLFPNLKTVWTDISGETRTILTGAGQAAGIQITRPEGDLFLSLIRVEYKH